MRQKWENNPNDYMLCQQLAYDSLVTHNYLPGAARIATGTGTDKDFWLQTTRGSTGVEDWNIVDGEGNVQARKVYRSARVPYLVWSKLREPTEEDARRKPSSKQRRRRLNPNQDPNSYLDHLLVGYTRNPVALTKPIGPWASGGGAANLRQLGELLTVWLPEGGHTTKWIEGWNQPRHATNYPFGYKPYSPPYDDRPTWQFRELSIRVDKMVEFSIAVDPGTGTFDARRLIVGYEGGGGW